MVVLELAVAFTSTNFSFVHCCYCGGGLTSWCFPHPRMSLSLVIEAFWLETISLVIGGPVSKAYSKRGGRQSTSLCLWGCHVYWQHLSHAVHWLSLTRQKLHTDDNFLQIPQGPPGRVPLINEGGDEQVHSNSDGVTNVPKCRNSHQCITDWIGEQDSLRTTVTCSPQSRIPNQYLETSQAHSFPLTLVQHQSSNPEVLARGLIGTWVRCRTLQLLPP